MRKSVWTKRHLSILVILALVLLLCVSAVTSTHHQKHDCSGDDCVICWCSALQKQLGKLLSILVLVNIFAVLPQYMPCIQHAVCMPLLCSGSPVMLKVKLSD